MTQQCDAPKQAANAAADNAVDAAVDAVDAVDDVATVTATVVDAAAERVPACSLCGLESHVAEEHECERCGRVGCHVAKDCDMPDFFVSDDAPAQDDAPARDDAEPSETRLSSRDMDD